MSNPGKPRITVHRVIDATELAVLRATGNCGSSPSRSGKYFALTLQGAYAFGYAEMNAGSTVTTTTLPASIVDHGIRFDDPGPHGAGPSVFFPEMWLPAVYGTMTPPVILPEES